MKQNNSQAPPGQQAVAREVHAEYWAERINAKCRACAGLLIQIGFDLIDAKERLHHGQWQRLFQKRLIPFCLRGAQRLMALARNPVIAKTTNWSFLPATERALYMLAKADPEALQRALTAKQITPLMTLEEATLFQNSHPALGVSSRAKRRKTFDADVVLARCTDFLWQQLENWPNESLDFFVDQLRSVVGDIQKAVADGKACKPSYDQTATNEPTVS